MRQETRGDAARFAGAAVRELTRTVAILPKPRREAGFIVLKAPEVPSVLVEMGFLSDPGDEAALRKPEHRALIAASLARAVEAWLTPSRPYLMVEKPALVMSLFALETCIGRQSCLFRNCAPMHRSIPSAPRLGRNRRAPHHHPNLSAPKSAGAFACFVGS